MSNLSDKDRLNLKEMVKSYGADDNSTKIRDLKHSRQIRDSVETLLKLKRKHSRMQKTNKTMFEKLIISKCNFLWNNYTNIFNRLLKDEIDVNILYKFIDKLREIEDGITDQHTASVDIGKILKEMYVDSALRKEKHYDANNPTEKKKERKPVKNISWNKFKSAGLGE
jgi:hypothetical protein